MLCYGVHQMAGSGKENDPVDKCPDVSPMASVSLCSTDVNADDSSPVLVPSFSSSQSGVADAADVPVPSSRHTPAFGSTSLLTGAVGARDLASGITRFVHAVIDQLFKPHHSTGY